MDKSSFDVGARFINKVFNTSRFIASIVGTEPLPDFASTELTDSEQLAYRSLPACI